MSNEYPRWVYQGGDLKNEGVIVNDADEEKAAKGFSRLGEKSAPAPAASLLDGTIADITPEIEGLSDKDLAKYRDEEAKAEKPRSTLLAAFDAEIEKRTA